MGKFSSGLYEQLSIYVRQTAWLWATQRPPEGEKPTPLSTRSRIEEARAAKGEGFSPDMPELGVAKYLASYLFDAGPLVAGNVLSHSEIESWQKNTGVRVEPWEVRLLRRLSSDYLQEARRAEDRAAPPPWDKARRAVQEAQVVRLKQNIRNLSTM